MEERNGMLMKAFRSEMQEAIDITMKSIYEDEDIANGAAICHIDFCDLKYWLTDNWYDYAPKWYENIFDEGSDEDNYIKSAVYRELLYRWELPVYKTEKVIWTKQGVKDNSYDE